MSQNLTPKKIMLDLSSARNGDIEYAAGQRLIAYDATDVNSTCEIVFDEESRTNSIPFKKGTKYLNEKGFNSFKVWNSAQAGKFLLLYVLEGAATLETPDAFDIGSVAGAVKTRSGDSLDHGPITVTTAATEIVAASASRNRISVVNNSTVDVFIGAASVTTSNGFPLKPEQSMTLDTGAAVYGTVASGTADVRFITEA